jgi:hypothetical protein
VITASEPSSAGLCGRCCVDGMRVWQARVESGSDGNGEFGEGRRELSLRVSIDAEFVVAAPEVLDERVAGANDAGGAQPFQSAHRGYLALSLP